MEKNCCRLCLMAFGLSIGIVWMAVVVIIGMMADFTATGYGMPFVNALSQMYVGYNATWLGITIGAVWAFIDGVIIGVAIAWFYNTFGLNCKKCN